MRSAAERAALVLLGTAVALAITACESARSTLPSSPSLAAISGLTVTPAQTTIPLDSSIVVTAAVLDASGVATLGRQVSWTSSAPAIATVASTGTLTARITAISPGSATVTASVEGHSASATIVVKADSAAGIPAAFIYTESEGTTTIPMPAGVRSSQASAINEAGQVVGEMQMVVDGCLHAFIWSRGTSVVDLGTLSDSQATGCGASARAINGKGEVVGYAMVNSNSAHAFKWSPATGMVDLGIQIGTTYSYATGINDSGVVVGQFVMKGGQLLRPFRWSPSRGVEVLSTPAGLGGYAVGINADGVIAGAVLSPDDSYGLDPLGAVLWKPDNTRVELSMCFDCWAVAINRTGQVAGALNARPAWWGSPEMGAS
jgi:probable HAF family extracellular repeat protein